MGVASWFAFVVYTLGLCGNGGGEKDNDQNILLNKRESGLQDPQVLYETGLALLKSNKLTKGIALIQKAAENNSFSNASEFLAQAYLFGDYLGRNISAAVSILTSLAERGNARGQALLGFCYSAGIGVPADEKKALLYYTFAALRGDVYANMIMAHRYNHGIDVAKNCQKALVHYRLVANIAASDVKQKHYTASVPTRLMVTDGKRESASKEDIIYFHQYQATRGDMSSQLIMGRLYYQGGFGITVDYKKAWQYFKKAEAMGSSHAKALLGELYLNGLGVEKNTDIALKYFQESANANISGGMNGLGFMYLHGLSLEQDIDRASKLFEVAISHGNVDAQVNLGTMYYNGLGMARDYQKAFTLFRKASQNGHTLAQYNIGVMFQEGRGTMKLCPIALIFLKNVCERGVWSSLLDEAYKAYEKGDLSASLLKYLLLAEMGYEVAESNLAYLLDKRIESIIPQDRIYSLALVYWNRAAKQNNGAAFLKIGDYHYYGRGVPVNFPIAATYYHKAGPKSAQALFNLAYLHEHGIGLQKDIHLARRYYDMAVIANPNAKLAIFFPRQLIEFRLVIARTRRYLYGIVAEEGIPSENNANKAFFYSHRLRQSLARLMRLIFGSNVDFDYITITALTVLLILLVQGRQFLYQRHP